MQTGPDATGNVTPDCNASLLVPLPAQKSNPNYQGVLSKARGSENQDSDPDYAEKRKRGIRSAFVSPMRADEKQGGGTALRRKQPKEDAVDEATLKW